MGLGHLDVVAKLLFGVGQLLLGATELIGHGLARDNVSGRCRCHDPLVRFER